MKAYIEEYGLMITAVIIILGLMAATATFGTVIKTGVNEKITAAVEDSGITQHVDGEESGDSVEISLDLSDANGILPISNGGTGATTVEQARENLELKAVALEDIVPIAKGGTGATTAAQARTNLGTISKAELVEKIYPVGSVYITTKNSNPQDLFGGTWTQISGRFLLASGSSYTLGTTGGSADAVNVSHTHSISLTSSTQSSHNHSHYNNTSGSVSTRKYVRNANGYSGTVTSSSNGNHTHTTTGTAENAGSSGVGANMPPYKAVYMWKRTA